MLHILIKLVHEQFSVSQAVPFQAISYYWPHSPPPSKIVQKSDMGGPLLWDFRTLLRVGDPPPPKVYKSPSTSADEALYYSTIYPNSCDLCTTE